MKVMVVDDDATFRAQIGSALERGMQACGGGIAGGGEGVGGARVQPQSRRFWI